MSALAALAAALAAILALGLHHAFWSRVFFTPTGEDEMLFAESADGWRLALAHRRPIGAELRPPVLLVHGIAANRVSVDFALERWSLSAHLAAAGFDCFALDLRGHGASLRARPEAPRAFSFDDHLRLDVPAALDAIRRATGAERVLWVGHSQGGLLGMAACAAYPDRIAGLVTLGSPAFFDRQTPLKLLVRFGFFFAGLNRFAARCLAPFAGFWHPPVGEVAINGRNVSRPVYRRVLANVVENISSGVLRQCARWITTDTFASLAGEVDYRAGLALCRQPALFVAAAADQVAPPAAVAKAARAWGGESTLLTIGVAGAACCDYGHSDLLFGRAAPEEVFPHVRDWLAAQAASALAPPARAPVPGVGAGAAEGRP